METSGEEMYLKNVYYSFPISQYYSMDKSRQVSNKQTRYQ